MGPMGSGPGDPDPGTQARGPAPADPDPGTWARGPGPADPDPGARDPDPGTRGRRPNSVNYSNLISFLHFWVFLKKSTFGSINGHLKQYILVDTIFNYIFHFGLQENVFT